MSEQKKGPQLGSKTGRGRNYIIATIVESSIDSALKAMTADDPIGFADAIGNLESINISDFVERIICDLDAVPMLPIDQRLPRVISLRCCTLSIMGRFGWMGVAHA